jgi:hypothetical protein
MSPKALAKPASICVQSMIESQIKPPLPTPPRENGGKGGGGKEKKRNF